MRFVAIKTPEQQSCLILHRTRHLLIRQQTSVINAIRAHLAEFGIVAALDRISIPQDVLDRIAPTALPRSSIIVSDEPLSRETNYRTEFVAVLNNQPQGGFVTRRPTVNVPVASANYWGNNGFGFFFQPNWNSQPGNMRPRAGQYYQRMQQRW